MRIGGVVVGGGAPIVVQSMTTPDPADVDANVAQALRLVEAGCAIVRVTTPTVKDADALGRIRDALRARRCDVPLVADIHFNPEAALRAADFADKVRVNPGNYADSRKFAVREYSDGEYDAELRRIEERFLPLVEKCARLGRALRIGTNHGSLSDRIMNRFGDNPAGMVESALEFVRIAVRRGFHDLVLSMKASNVRVMVAAYRLLAARMAEEGFDHPFHLGVTEAGGGLDGRVKSAAGIGALLLDGIGDTVRVSLTEDPVKEIPVALALVAPFNEGRAPGRAPAPAPDRPLAEARSPFDPRRRATDRRAWRGTALGGDEPVRVGLRGGAAADPAADLRREPPAEFPGGDDADGPVEAGAPILLRADLRDGESVETAARRVAADAARRTAAGTPVVVAAPVSADGPFLARAVAAALDEVSVPAPLLLSARYAGDPVTPARDLGALLVDGIGDAVEVDAPAGLGRAALDLAYAVLQGTRVRMTRTDYIACPGCGRTLFDLEETTDRIRARTGHLKGLKIAVMGCIVNGPGEMADADFGYVGSAVGRVNLYVGRDCVERNVAAAEADDRLVALIRERGRWVEP